MITNFFQEFYTADQNVKPEEIINSIQPRITYEMNKNLCGDFSDDEISNALFQIRPLKALGADGFPARFYQRHWGTLKEDVIRGVREYFRTGHMSCLRSRIPGVKDTPF